MDKTSCAGFITNQAISSSINGPATAQALESFLVVSSGNSTAFDYSCRRVLGIALAIILLIILAPLLLLIGILIRIDSPGPALFVQNRVRSNRRRDDNGQIVWETQLFRCYKFRSMWRNADSSVHQEYIRQFCQGEVVTDGSTEAQYKLKGDVRVTRMGQFLRRTSLDELPQLLNVLKGDMTLVGPRPVPAYEVVHYQKAHHERFAALPGITGLWQIRGRGRVPFEEMMQMDIEYVQTCSLRMDLEILLATIPAVLGGWGAR